MSAMASAVPGLAKGFAPGSTGFAASTAAVAPAVTSPAVTSPAATAPAALASGGAGDVNWRPFVLLATSRLNAFREQLHALLLSWCLDWGIDASEARLECLRAEGGQAGQDRQDWQGSQAGVWFMVGSGWLAALRSQMWQESTPNTDSLAASSALAAHQDWLARLKNWPASPANSGGSNSGGSNSGSSNSGSSNGGGFSGASGFGGPSATHCFAPGSGAVLARLLVGSQSFEMLFANPAAWLPALPASPALKSGLPAPLPRSAALGKLAVRLQVEAGRTEVALGQLLALAVGDVIRLEHSIDAPLRVVAPKGEHVFDGYLGKRGERMALELVPR